MPSLSNLYADKVFSEHPSALWSFDDQLDYASLITDTDRLASTWTITNGTKAVSTAIDSRPFKSSPMLLITGDAPVGDSEEVTLISNNLVNFTALDQDLTTLTISSYFYTSNPYITGVSIGYEYTSTLSGNIVQEMKDVTFSVTDKWSLVSQTFNTVTENTNVRIVIKIRYNSGSADPYEFYINGITLGQWSEEFNATSLGVSTSSFPTSEINLSASTIYDNPPKVVEASQYSLTSDNGYYLVQDNLLKARNSGVPMVYGSSHITTLYNNEDLPSLIVPGKGFLNNVGRYKDYTVEMWLRINSSTTEPFRFFGPINSLDGLYVDGPFLTLVIGDQYSSHFINEWFRPMLVHVRIINNSATLVLNGEEVISIKIDNSTLVLPEEYVDGKSQDWLGFYCSADVSPIELDCLAIYNYKVPEVVAKRRLVYGQGVLSPEGLNQAYSGVTTFIDYPFANYSANYSYPNIGSWQQGVIDNLDAGKISLSTPDYDLPDVTFEDSSSLLDLYSANKTIQDSNKFISLSPNLAFANIGSYIRFNSLNFSNTKTKSFYGIFKNIDEVTEEQTLFYIENKVNGDYLSASILNGDILYKLKSGNSVSTLETSTTYTDNEVFCVGFDIDSLSRYFGESMTSFFGNISQLSVYVGNNKNMDKKFNGYIYRVGFSTGRNFNEISSSFNENGIIVESSDLMSHIASYTLTPEVEYDRFYLDIAVAGYWEDYIPLSYFSKEVVDPYGNKVYDLDFLQYNIGFPVKSKFKAIAETTSWSYGDLKDSFSVPDQKTYADLDNSLYTGYQNYEDLALNRTVSTYHYDTDNQPVKSYISFQYIKEGANQQPELFTSIENISKNGVVDADLYSDWRTRKFEVVDNVIVHPPHNVNFEDVAIVLHLEFKTRGIVNKKINIKKLELASQSFSETTFNEIGTRFGSKIIPYSKSGIYYDYKGKNPFTIYKGSTPYLYLTRTSGIQVRGDFDALTNRGLAIPINGNSAVDYKVSAMQMAMRFDEEAFPITPTSIFEINYRNNTIKFFMVSIGSDNQRAKIYAINSKTGQKENGIAFYINGNIVAEPVINLKSWAFLGFSFSSPLSFDRYSGALNLNGPVLFNNISYYKSTNLQQAQSVSVRPWLKVKTSGLIDLDWDFWVQAYIWNGVLVFSEYYTYGVDPSDIYSTYIGNNKITIDSEDSLTFTQDSSVSYFNTKWQQYIANPV